MSATAKAPVALTDRERKMLALLVKGATSRTIAQRTKLEEGTVRVYLSHLYKKIGVVNRTEAAVWFVRRGA